MRAPGATHRAQRLYALRRQRTPQPLQKEPVLGVCIPVHIGRGELPPLDAARTFGGQGGGGGAGEGGPRCARQCSGAGSAGGACGRCHPPTHPPMRARCGPRQAQRWAGEAAPGPSLLPPEASRQPPPRSGRHATLACSSSSTASARGARWPRRRPRRRPSRGPAPPGGESPSAASRMSPMRAACRSTAGRGRGEGLQHKLRVGGAPRQPSSVCFLHLQDPPPSTHTHTHPNTTPHTQRGQPHSQPRPATSGQRRTSPATPRCAPASCVSASSRLSSTHMDSTASASKWLALTTGLDSQGAAAAAAAGSAAPETGGDRQQLTRLESAGKPVGSSTWARRVRAAEGRLQQATSTLFPVL